MNWTRVIAAIALVTVASPNFLNAAEPVRRQYTATNAEFLNPERGFYRYRNLTNPTNLAGVRASGQTLIYGRVLADQFRDKPLSDSFLAKIQAGFDEVRKHGLKVKFRLAYNSSISDDAPKDVILNHIQQLKPLWEKNKDVMFHMDAGFIGAWGEWHSSTNGLDNATDRRDILFAILDALPVDRTVGIRTPHFKREAFSGSQTSDEFQVTEENAFDGSRISRVGHLNDCFLSSGTDVGTYALINNNWPLNRELKYIGQESRFVPFGGETCGVHARSESSRAIQEMETLHIDYLNLDYHPDVIQRWKDEGSFDEIQRRLGYRFELQSATFPAAVRPGSLIPFQLEVGNVGFGELFNPRKIEVTLQHGESKQRYTAPLRYDPRQWIGGTTKSLDTWLMIPQDLPAGDYSVGLWLPDIEASLRDDPRYAIRFANENVWDAATGINQLAASVTIASTVAGQVYQEATEFREVLDPAALNLLGDFNFDRQLDAADIDQLATMIGSADLAFDITQDGVVDSEDIAFWIAEIAQTQTGDADLDGDVDFADFLNLSSHFGEAGGWGVGNFDYTSTVDFADFLSLSANFGAVGQTQQASVPEPERMWVWTGLLFLHVRKLAFGPKPVLSSHR